MRLLVLGGTRFVGRAIVDAGLARDWEVTVLNRGVTGSPPAPVRTLIADRTDEATLRAALGDEQWDVVVDTWSGAPHVATWAAEALATRAKRYAYVSSISVYAWGHVDEDSALVVGDPDSTDDDDYAAAKRGAELGIERAVPEVLLARAGLILGPHEDIGRLPWWLDRISAGERVVAPGDPQRPLQYIDARDLAAFLLDATAGGVSGPIDVIGPSGHATTERLLGACIETTGSGAELVWIDESELEAAGVEPWTHLPCWVPRTGEFAGFLEADTSRAQRSGLLCRPVEATVRDTWEWMCRDGLPEPRVDRPRHGLPRSLEAALLRER